MTKYDDPELNKAIKEFKRELMELRLLKAIERFLVWLFEKTGGGK